MEKDRRLADVFSLRERCRRNILFVLGLGGRVLGSVEALLRVWVLITTLFTGSGTIGW